MNEDAKSLISAKQTAVGFLHTGKDDPNRVQFREVVKQGLQAGLAHSTSFLNRGDFGQAAAGQPVDLAQSARTEVCRDIIAAANMGLRI